MVATGEISQPSKASRPRVGPIQLPWIVPAKPPASPPKTPTPPKPSSPVQALALIQPPTLLPGFVGVTAYLQTPELVEVALEVPLGTMPIGVVVTHGISIMSMSHIVRDEATGVTYMDTVTTSVEGLPLVVQIQKPHPQALQSRMLPTMSRQLADNCHWADNQLSPLQSKQTFPITTIEQTNISITTNWEERM